METSSPNREPKSESVLPEEEAKPFVEESVDVKVPELELEKKREGKFEFDLMVNIHVVIFQIAFQLVYLLKTKPLPFLTGSSSY